MQLRTDEHLHSNKLRSLFPAGKNCHDNMRRHTPIEESRDEPGDEEYVLKRGNYSVRLVNSLRQLNRTRMLIQRRYSWRGYHADASVALSHSFNQLTLEAASDHALYGTLTLGIDSEEGLLADELYKQEIDTFRREGRKVCELSKFAVDPQFSSKEILASLFHLAYIFGRNIHKATDLFIEVNPRHTGFYNRMLGLYQIGEERMCLRVGAPAVLMHLELDFVDAQIASLAGSCKSGERSLYPYFFSQHEEESLANTLRQHVN